MSVMTAFVLLKIQFFGHSEMSNWNPTVDRPKFPCWLRFHLSDAQHNRCLICWKPFNGGFDREIDHRFPLNSKNIKNKLELNRLSNFAVVHPKCHRQKTATSDQKFLYPK
jgi:5-methylcytosine-specific restriction endonuclease McrA